MKRLLTASALLALPVLIIGCEKKEKTTTPPATPAAGTVRPSAPAPTDRTTGMTGQLQGAAGQATSGVQSMATTQLDQVNTYIQQGKLDMADQALTKVEQQKASLPESLQTRVTDLRKRLDQAKTQGGGAAAGATTQPTMPVAP